MRSNLIYSFAVIMLLGFLFATCTSEKKEEPQKSTKPPVKVIPPEKGNDEVNPVEKKKEQIVNLTGKWTGKFDKRAATLTITEQTGMNFKGKIVINYRQVINQEIEGTFDPVKMEINMKDLLHSRFQGKYSGKLEKETMSFAGLFTMDLDGKKFDFNLKKNK